MVERCAVCGWPIAKTWQDGCVPGNCSMRPLPESLYDPQRVVVEYGPIVGPSFVARYGVEQP